MRSTVRESIMSAELPAPARVRTRTLLQLLLLVALAVALLMARTVSIDATLLRLNREVEALGVWGPLVFGGLFVVTTMLLLPATPVVLAAGALFGTLTATATISVASTLSAFLSFVLSRHLAHDWIAARVVGYRRVHLLYRALGGEKGWKVVAAVRLAHLLPYGVQNLLFGLSPVRVVPFLAATWVAMLPGTLLYSYLGHLGARALEVDGAPPLGPEGWAFRLGLLAVIVVAVLYIGRLARHVLQGQGVAVTSVDRSAESVSARS